MSASQCWLSNRFSAIALPHLGQASESEEFCTTHQAERQYKRQYNEKFRFYDICMAAGSYARLRNFGLIIASLRSVTTASQSMSKTAAVMATPIMSVIMTAVRLSPIISASGLKT